ECELRAEEVLTQLVDRPLAGWIGPGRDAEDGPEPGSECPGGGGRRRGATGRGSTPRALQPMQAVLVHRRLDRRHLGDLVPPWLRIVAVELMALAAAVRRPALGDLPDAVGP